MNILEAKIELERHRGRTDIRLDELVQIANHLINLVVPSQPSDRVAENLNERTLRYYITEGLIDRPVGKEGTAALYGYRHLLQALIVKALQGAYLPIKRIREILAGKNDRELDAILACQVEIPAGKDGMGPLEATAAGGQEMDRPTARRQALDYLNHLQEPSPPPVREAKMAVTEPPPASLRYEDHNTIFSQRSSHNELPASNSWERFPLEDGVELHVRKDRVKRLRGSEIKRVLERLLNLLKSQK
jgi:DNA-binding transcriptional MerR regulator